MATGALLQKADETILKPLWRGQRVRDRLRGITRTTRCHANIEVLPSDPPHCIDDQTIGVANA